MGREGKRRGGGKGKKGKGWRREGENVTEGMGGTGQNVGWDGEGREGKGKGGRGGKGRRGATAPPKFQFLAPTLRGRGTSGYAVVTTTIRRAFDASSTVYQRSLSAQ